MIYALHLLEQLQQNGLKFTFKGGTSLVLLLEEGNRFSIDIDQQLYAKYKLSTEEIDFIESMIKPMG